MKTNGIDSLQNLDLTKTVIYSSESQVVSEGCALIFRKKKSLNLNSEIYFVNQNL